MHAYSNKRIILPPITPTPHISLNTKFTIELLISLLPDELKFKIYKDHFEPKYYYEIYISLINSQKSSALEYNLLSHCIPLFLSKQNVINYLYQKSEPFQKSYYQHKIIHQKNFKKMKKGDSFALSILMQIYH